MNVVINKKPLIKIWFSDFWRPAKREYILRNALYKLLSKYYELILSKDPDFLLYSNFGHDYLKYDCIRIFYTGENVRPNFDECDYAFSFDYPTDERNYRLPLYRFYNSYEMMLRPRTPTKIMAENRRFCGFLASNPSGLERNAFFKMLSSYKDVDSGGKVFNNTKVQVPRGDEISWLSNYKFSIAFENSSFPGYTTEKLPNALAANTIPIYWGNPLIDQDFNSKAYINCHDFASFEEVIHVVTEVDQDPDLYSRYLSEPVLPGGNEIECCKEENIIARFDEIFSMKQIQVSVKTKRSQKLKYPYRKITKLIRKALYH